LIIRKLNLWKKDEYHYPHAMGFIPNIRAYLHETGELRPAVMVIPGGGYSFASVREGAPVARRFYKLGFNAFVLTYTTNPLQTMPLGDQPAADAARAIRLIRSKNQELFVDPHKLAVCGFSAGGHLAGTVSNQFGELTDPDPDLASISARPDASILCYPVITTDEAWSHKGSFLALLGETPGKRMLNHASLEKHVTKKTPPTFLWATMTDQSVPVENTLLYAKALREKGIPFALHLFSQGKHGLSLADEDWANRRCKEDYTHDQLFRVLRAVETGEIPVSEEKKTEYFTNFSYGPDAPPKPLDVPVPEVQVWPENAAKWLHELFRQQA